MPSLWAFGILIGGPEVNIFSIFRGGGVLLMWADGATLEPARDKWVVIIRVSLLCRWMDAS